MKPILISLGDPAGIGPEVTFKAIKLIKNHPGILIFGHPNTIPKSIEPYSNNIGPNELKYIAIEPELKPQKSFNDKTNALIAYKSILTALEFSQNHPIHGLVTAPISKAGFLNAGIKTTDHTTLLKTFFKRPNAGMAFYSEKIKVMLATIHIALSDVESALTNTCLRNSINNAFEFAKSIGYQHPKIAIAGLNPHAGENGQFGLFEKDTLMPLIEQYNQEKNVKISGPISPDTIFNQAVNGNHDITIALYHDQGLIPLKLLAFDNAVNVTIGLPICRTSPDHGTAYDIAGKNTANPNAMKAAIDYVIQFGT